MKKLFIFLSFFLMLSCTAKRIAVLRIPETSFARYIGVEIADFCVKTPTIVPRDVLLKIPDEIAIKLKNTHLFSHVVRYITPQKDKTLVIRGIITQFQPGSRIKRGLCLGLEHIGAGYVTVRISFFDKQTQRKIAELDVESQVNWGLTGGNLEVCYQKIAQEVVKFIKFYY